MAKSKNKITIVSILFLAVPALAGLRTVTSDVDNAAGAMRFMVDSASSGDTVTFDCPGTDTVKMQAPVSLFKNLFVIGKNASMRGRIVIQCSNQGRESPFRISGCTATFMKMTIMSISSADTGGIFNVTGGSSKLILDSVSLTRGSAACGGGIYVNAGSLNMNCCRIVNLYGCGIWNSSGHCTILNSSLSKNSTYSSGSGGAMHCEGGTVEMRGDSLFQNSADYGGGAVSLKDGSLVLDHCVISRNTSKFGGGGVYLFSGTIDAAGCAIVGNRTTSDKGGGIRINAGTASFSASDISGNFSPASGGGIHVENGRLDIRGGSLTHDSAAYVYDYKSTPAFSSSPSASTAGGCISVANGIISIADAMIAGNRSSVSAPNVTNAGNDLAYWGYATFGGALYVSGAIVTIARCTLADNIADVNAMTGSSIVGLNTESDGGGIYNDSGHVMVLNSSIVNNRVSSYAATLAYNTRKVISSGSGVYNKSGEMILVNSTIAKNVISGYGGCMYNGSGKMTVVYGTVSCNVNQNTGSDGGWAVQNGAGGSCFFLNTILAGNTAGDYSSASDSQSRSAYCLFGAGKTRFARYCSDGVTNLQIFGSATPSLRDSGGPLPTLHLGSLNSIAVGAGARAGTYGQSIQVADTQVALLRAAYFDPELLAWRSLESDARLAADVHVEEISIDQRGKPRPNPSCAGAFEMTSGDHARAGTLAAAQERSVVFSGRRLTVISHAPAGIDVSLFTLLGRKVYATGMRTGRGKHTVTLPETARGTFVCRIRSAGETIDSRYAAVR
jgi:hypothetical protein